MKKSKTPGVCVFCGRTPVTDEHLWPQRIGRLLPRSAPEATLHAQRQFLRQPLVGGGERSMFHNRNARGPFRSRKIRKVCGQHCNGGWMSRIEDRAARTMTPLIKGQAAHLDHEDLRLIANWAALTSIIGEFTDLNSAAIPGSDRLALMSEWTRMRELESNAVPSLPDGWIVEIGSRQPAVAWRPTYAHVGATWVPSGETVTNARPNVQTTTISVGHIVIRTGSTKFELSLPRDRQAEGLVEIWPRTPDSLEWPPRPSLTGEDVEWIGNILGRARVSLPG